MHKSYIPAIIIATLAASSVASPYFYSVSITQRLAKSACVASAPVFDPKFSVLGFREISTGQWIVTVHVEGVIAYVPYGQKPCSAVPQPLSQDFYLPIFSATPITNVEINYGNAFKAMIRNECMPCSRTFQCNVPLRVTVTNS